MPDRTAEDWLKAARPNEDAELARDAVLEGSAMAAMVDYLMLGTGRSLKDVPDFDPGMLIGDLSSTPTLQKAPPFLKDALIGLRENVNTGGVALTIFELMTATYAAENFELRKDWDRRSAKMRRHCS